MIINSVYQTILDKLEYRVMKAKIHNPKAHQGDKWIKTALLSSHEDLLKKGVGLTVHTLISRFKSDTSNSPLGHAMSGEVTIGLGKNIEAMIGQNTSNTDLHGAIGASFLGIFLSEEYIKQEREPGFSEHDQRAPYAISPLEKFSELGDIPEEIAVSMIKATVFEPIPQISTMIQGHGRSIIKGYNEQQEADLKVAIAIDAPWIKACNKLQNQGFQINPEVYEVLASNYLSMLKPIPPRPNLATAGDVKNAFEALKKNDNKRNRDKYNRTVKLWNRELETISAISKNSEIGSILSKAKVLLNAGTFYQFVELDYRGRIYYQEPFLNYQGTDMSRGMLQFSTGKRLGQDGVRWLAIHTANSYNESFNINEIPSYFTHDYKSMLEEQNLEDISVDKMTLKDREIWTYENMEKILDSRDKLLDCEKPVGFLACCVEWGKVQKDGFDTISHLPVAIDGSCNGYQHSAAISKDEITGSLVSLTDQAVQEDLYLRVAQELVKEMPEFFDARPDMKMKHIRKGIAKRAVMTRAYSAGVDKIADSMYKDCHAYGYTDKFDITMLDCIALAKVIYRLIRTVCPGATRTMEFLQHLATYELGKFDFFDTEGNKVSKNKRKKLHARKKQLRKIKANEISQEELKELNTISETLESHELRCVYGNGNKSLNWMTPSGFQVIYEDWIKGQDDIKVTYPGWTGGAKGQPGRIHLRLAVDRPYPCVSGFQSGVSPNMIHSMDASHMAIVIANWEGSFGAVHDSFSAHAADIEELSKVTREKFADLYDVDDPFAALAEMVLSPCVYDEELPELGDLDIQSVNKATYFFC